jgi:hypothetical protein
VAQAEAAKTEVAAGAGCSSAEHTALISLALIEAVLIYTPRELYSLRVLLEKVDVNQREVRLETPNGEVVDLLDDATPDYNCLVLTGNTGGIGSDFLCLKDYKTWSSYGNRVYRPDGPQKSKSQNSPLHAPCLGRDFPSEFEPRGKPA